MSRRRRDSEKVDGCLVALVLPLAILCAFPILLLPIAIFLVLALVIGIVEFSEFLATKKKNKKQKDNEVIEIETTSSKNGIKEASVVTENVVEEKEHNTFSFNEILSICDNIEDKLLEIELSYAEIEEDNEELDSLYFELEEYGRIIDGFKNKKLIELNDDLIVEVKDTYNNFIELYDQFNLLIDEYKVDVVDDEENKDAIDLCDAVVAGALGYVANKKYEEYQAEKEREEYREELRNVWGLTEYQIGLVESGEYEPCQFSEEELEDDDYYSED